MDQTVSVKPSDGFNYYRGEIYWNTFPAVRAHINRLVTGDAETHWRALVGARYGRGECAFVPNCGNGQAERDLFKNGAVASVFGVDIDTASISAARAEADALGMPAEYAIADINTLDLTGRRFDRIVNNAAFHHIAYLDRFMRSALEALNEDGLLISWDYVGPHRNQYPWRIWSRVVELNASLPAPFRLNLHYPAVREMIAADPSEAVHSELIESHIARYFDIVELKRAGGALAYTLLLQNRALFDARDTAEGRETVQRIIEADLAYTRYYPDDSLFNFCVARPRKAALEDKAQLSIWRAEEDAREAAAAQNGGRYYPPNTIEIIWEGIDEVHRNAAWLITRNAELERAASERV